MPPTASPGSVQRLLSLPSAEELLPRFPTPSYPSTPPLSRFRGNGAASKHAELPFQRPEQGATEALTVVVLVVEVLVVVAVVVDSLSTV